MTTTNKPHHIELLSFTMYSRKSPDLEDDIDERYLRQDCRMYLRMLIETSLAVGFVVAVTMVVLAKNNAHKCCEP